MTSAVICLKWSYIWKVENFSSVKDRIRSPVFSIALDDSNTMWGLDLYPKCSSNKCRGFVGINLNLISSNIGEVEIKLTLSIVNRMGFSSKPVETVTKMRPNKAGCRLNLIKRTELYDKDNGFLVDDCVNILCTIGMGDHTKGKCIPSDEAVQLEGVKNNKNNLYWQCFLNQTLVDATIVVNTKEFKVHRMVLAAHSRVFSAMFSREMKEGISNSVTIDDCDSDVFMEFLRFAYLNQVENLSSVAPGLLIFCEKYDVEDLKLHCEKAMYETLSVSNALEILTLADTHRAPWLKALTMDFVTANALEITQTEDWKTLMIDSKLLKEIFQAQAEFNSNLL